MKSSMEYKAAFYFHDNLRDFLKRSYKNSWIEYPFNGNPAVKDAIESIGIPHPEVASVIVNNLVVDFSYSLNHDDRVDVYPFNAESLSSISNYYHNKFVLDVHLGRLAKASRMLGFDTSYENDYTNKALVDIASRDKRIVLTRDVGLLKHKLIEVGYWLRSQQPEEQLREVIHRFFLHNSLQPFTRCIQCNGIIEGVPKDEIVEKLPPKTILYFSQFYQCSSCRKVYWKGSHYERMMEFVERIKAK